MCNSCWLEAGGGKHTCSVCDEEWNENDEDYDEEAADPEKDLCPTCYLDACKDALAQRRRIAK
jgi:hypothetical protein